MTRTDYQTAVRRMQRIMFITSLVIAGPVLWFMMRLMGSLGGPVRSYGSALTSRFGDMIGGALVGLSFAPVAIIPLLVWVAVMLVFDRRVGVRCPHCHR